MLIRFLSWIALLIACVAAPAAAQDSPTIASAKQLSLAETDLLAVDRALDTKVDADARKTLRAKAFAAQQATVTSIAQLRDELGRTEARITGLGPAAAGIVETPEIRVQRAELSREHAMIDSALKRGRLADVEAQQLIDEIDRNAADQFNETLSARVFSPVTPAFWGTVLKFLPRDLRRIELFLSQGADQVRRQWRGGLPWQAIAGAILGFVILFPLRRYARQFGQRYLIEDAPGHRVRRSANALWRLFLGTLAPLMAAIAIVQGLRWAGLQPERWNALLDAFVGAAGFAGFIAASTGAVLMRSQASWRIAPINDATADRLRPLSWLLAGLSSASLLMTTFNATVGASHPAVVATQAVIALLHLVLIGALLRDLGRLRAERADLDDASSLSTSASLGLTTLIAWLSVGTAIVALLLGYIGFSLFIAQLIAWLIILGSAIYVLMKVIDDLSSTFLKRDSRLGLTLTRGLGVRGSVVDQFGLLLSGVLRLATLMVGLGLLVTPFGAGGGIGDMFGRLGTFAQGIEFGGVSISPGTILRGIIVLFVGLALVRGFMGWLEGRYLPATDLDGSGRNSVSLVVRYIGIALACIWALASLGIGVERVALLLSALSVGIGFGLQAITQNFVSGLILLAERPIKIGDLVRVGTDEGDVKRISVRSTEIELADHSTLIVPNSELITKTVLNKTLANPPGRVQIAFTVPLGTDVRAVRRAVMEAFAGEDAILADPAPAVFIDALTDDRVAFKCFAHVASPRITYRTRSNVFMTLLDRFRDEGIAIGTVALPPVDPAPAATPSVSVR